MHDNKNFIVVIVVVVVVVVRFVATNQGLDQMMEKWTQHVLANKPPPPPILVEKFG